MQIFLNYKKNKLSITGANYFSLRSGPCPQHYNEILNMFKTEGDVNSKGINIVSYSRLKAPDLSLFSPEEFKTIKEVQDFYCGNQGNSIYQFSLKEQGCIKTRDCAFISYKHASELLI